MLFGHQNDVNQPQLGVSDQSAQPYVSTQDPVAITNPLAVDPATGASLPVVTPDSPGPVDTPDELSVLNQPSAPAVTVSGTLAPAASASPSSAFVPATDAAVAPDPGSPFGADPVSTTPAEAQEAASIATELDTPGTDNSTVLTPDTQGTAAAVNTQLDPQPLSSSVFGNDASDDASTGAPTPVADDLLGLKQQAISQLSPLVGHLDQTPEEKFRTTMMLIQSTDDASLLQDAYNAAQNIPDDKVRAQALLDIVNEINYFTQQKGNDQAT